MIPVAKVRRLWLAFHRVDFRKQEKGLLAEVFSLGLDPFDGDLVIFIGRGRRVIKLLFADSSGLWLGKKAFSAEAMKTKFTFLSQPSVQSISSGDLAMLLEGTDYAVQKRVKNWPREP
jgi:transposase